MSRDPAIPSCDTPYLAILFTGGLTLQLPKAVVLNTVWRRNTQMRVKSANERKRAQTQVRKRAQNGVQKSASVQKSQTTRFETTRFENFHLTLPHNGAIPPLVHSFTQAHLCDTQCSDVSRDNHATPHKNKREKVWRYYRFRYRAMW